jgi:WD40-like Beta Propeller Repeat
MFWRYITKSLLVFSLFSLFGCEKNAFKPSDVSATTLRDVAALKLNFRYEADVPMPTVAANSEISEQKNAAIQADFDQNRPLEVLEKTLVSPDKQRILVIYRKPEDHAAELRLDMYSADGKLLKSITPNGLAVHFQDSIVWSPDGNTLAFVGMIRVNQVSQQPIIADAPIKPDLETPNSNSEINSNISNASIESNSNTNANISPTPQPEKGVLTLRTEQLYTCNRDGNDLKILTQNDGLIYFFFVWSPDSLALAALAATWKEWQIGQFQADQSNEIFIPSGRPRLVEKNGRVRILDDSVTKVHPVWSPDSSKIAFAFDKDIRINDAIGNSPTQASIQLKNKLLESSETYDEFVKRTEAGENITIDVVKNSNSNTGVRTLPAETSLVSFNPITELAWTNDNLLYFQTAYVKEYKESANNTRSFMRWHRLALSPQAVNY